jgi:hypothetical protein
MADLTGSTFYSETNPANVGGAPSDQLINPEVITPPPYDMRVDQGGESFRPSPVSDPTFQPELQNVPNPPATNWALIAAGAFLLYLMFNSGGHRGRR